MGILAAIALGAAYEAEQARLRDPPDPDPPSAGDYWRAAKSCYPGVFAPRQLARGIAEVEVIEQERRIERAALEAHRQAKRSQYGPIHSHPRPGVVYFKKSS